MVPTYFHLKLEFDARKVDSMIQTTIARRGKGYVCLVESNLVALANRGLYSSDDYTR